MIRPGRESADPEHIATILQHVLSDIERNMIPEFDPQLSLKIDSVFFLLDSFCTPSGGEDETEFS